MALCAAVSRVSLRVRTTRGNAATWTLPRDVASDPSVDLLYVLVLLKDGQGAPAYHVLEAAVLAARIENQAAADPPGGPRFSDADGSHLDKWDALDAPAGE